MQSHDRFTANSPPPPTLSQSSCPLMLLDYACYAAQAVALSLAGQPTATATQMTATAMALTWLA